MSSRQTVEETDEKTNDQTVSWRDKIVNRHLSSSLQKHYSEPVSPYWCLYSTFNTNVFPTPMDKAENHDSKLANQVLPCSLNRVFKVYLCLSVCFSVLLWPLRENPGPGSTQFFSGPDFTLEYPRKRSDGEKFGSLRKSDPWELSLFLPPLSDQSMYYWICH